ncbi:TetR/AcrR family transcriptional regulator, partial [Agromyces sp. NPDC058484]|uniref:TetR/AcrR family transcriptional regulator n=1 Tax=Agromyces sp. NPDC058484 TaxID=3346524 RepID=UPI00365E1973
MARRLTPEARRAEIIEVTQSAIASDGYRGLSLREIARRCGMSAPGLMHYFSDMPTLLEAVLDHRDEVDLAAILDDDGFDMPLLEMLDTSREYYAARPAEARSFDLLEAEALDPGHPAHDYFVTRNERTFERIRPQIEREFENGDEVARVLRLLLDG